MCRGILRKRCVFVYLGLRMPRPPWGHLSVCTCPPFGGATPTPVPSFALPIPHCAFCGPGHVHGLPPSLTMSPHFHHFICGSSLCRKEPGWVPGVPKQTLSFALGRGGEGVQSSQVLGPVLRGPPHATFKTSPHIESRGPEMGE